MGARAGSLLLLLLGRGGLRRWEASRQEWAGEAALGAWKGGKGRSQAAGAVGAVGEHGLHCRLQELKLVLGLHNLHDPREPGLTFYIREAIKHPGYNHRYENDLALLKVRAAGRAGGRGWGSGGPATGAWLPSVCHSLVFPSPQLDGRVQPSRNVKPLSLPRKPRSRPAEGARCSTAGWGLTRQGGHLARALQELDLRVLDTRMCNNSRFWNGVLVDSMLCLKAGTKSQAPCKVKGVACRPRLGSSRNQPLIPQGVEGGWDCHSLISQTGSG